MEPNQQLAMDNDLQKIPTLIRDLIQVCLYMKPILKIVIWDKLC